jgi:hypothetical protein
VPKSFIVFRSAALTLPVSTWYCRTADEHGERARTLQHLHESGGLDRGDERLERAGGDGHVHQILRGLGARGQNEQQGEGSGADVRTRGVHHGGPPVTAGA